MQDLQPPQLSLDIFKPSEMTFTLVKFFVCRFILFLKEKSTSFSQSSLERVKLVFRLTSCKVHTLPVILWFSAHAAWDCSQCQLLCGG